jgi:hypothetical protein
MVEQKGRDGRTKCLERGGVYPIYVGARGSHPRGVQRAPTPFLLFMVVVTPSFMER